jgi:hypothetical protein
MAANSAFTRMLSSRTRLETSASLSARSRACPSVHAPDGNPNVLGPRNPKPIRETPAFIQ